jgi:predicted AlkP superfamily pyrophosphatase or phosphodiesterase
VLLLVLCAGISNGAGVAEHVVLIGLDGCRPEAIQQAAGPVLKGLWEEGAWSWSATAVLPSVTQVNFASILTSSVPEKHGISSKEWTPGMRPKLAATTIFELVAQNGFTAAGFLGHEKLYPSEPVEEKPGIYIEHSKYDAKAVAPVAAKYLKEQKPHFCFIYMGDLDGAGHKYGWLSPEQLQCMENIDQAVGQIVDALKEAQMWSKTLVIITSDHGGHGKSHSAGTPEDTTVPWIAAGPLVKRGEIKGPVRSMDTAATSAFALGLPQRKEWDGKPITEAFRSR